MQYLILIWAILLVGIACEDSVYTGKGGSTGFVVKVRCSDAELDVCIKQSYPLEDDRNNKIRLAGGIEKFREGIRPFCSCSVVRPIGAPPPKSPEIKLTDDVPVNLPKMSYDTDLPEVATDDPFKGLVFPEMKLPDDLRAEPPKKYLDTDGDGKVEENPQYNFELVEYQDGIGKLIAELKESVAGGDTETHTVTKRSIAKLETMVNEIGLIQSAEIEDEDDGVRVSNGIASIALGSAVTTTEFAIEVELEQGWEGLAFYASGVVGIDLNKHNYYNKLRIEIRASQNSWAVFNTDGVQLESGELWVAGYYSPLIKWAPLGVTLHNAKLISARFETL